MTPYGIKTLRLGQNGCHFADDIFRCNFLNENACISIDISLNFVPGGQINNIPALVPIMAWRRPEDKPLSEPTRRVNGNADIGMLIKARQFLNKVGLMSLYYSFIYPYLFTCCNHIWGATYKTRLNSWSFFRTKLLES